jgi:GNAT superfamily N-acetyltransferase
VRVPEPDADEHPLLPVLLAAAAGRFPPVDGRVEFGPELRPGLRCVLSFTGHAYVATAQVPADFADLDPDGFGRALQPEVLLRLAGPRGRIGVLDGTLVRAGTGRGAELTRRTDLDAHPRVQHARDIRLDVRVYGDERGLVTLSHGLAGRLELSIEVDDALQGKGIGGSLLADGLDLVPAGTPVFAAVSPGNVRSLRLFLAAGFTPIGSEVIVQTG